MNRHSARLAGFDYTQDGAYFITIVTQGRACLFGNIANGEMVLNKAGLMVAQVCFEMPHVIQSMRWRIFQIMPNHFHALVELHNAAGADPSHAGADPSHAGADPSHVGADLRGCPGQTRRSAPTGNPLTLGNVVGRFKSLTTRRYIDGVRTAHWPQFSTRLWQRNYYEHIIRDETDYQSIYEYVLCNPQNWEMDSENPLK